MESKLAEELIKQVIFRINENIPRIKKCLKELTEEEIWKRPNKASNSIGNLIVHLNGNITQYILSSLGELEDTRNREEEFIASGGLNKDELIEKISFTVAKATTILDSINTEDLLKKRSVQGMKMSGIGIIIHVTEHFSYHTGQIAFCTKLLKSKDLGFYKGQDLNKKNIIHKNK